jgi:hypothetical protein
VVSQVKNQMIIEAIWRLYKSQTWCKHAPSQPNKASKDKTTITCFHIIKTTHDFFQRLIKQSQSFETSHATTKTTKHTIKRHQS